MGSAVDTQANMPNGEAMPNGDRGEDDAPCHRCGVPWWEPRYHHHCLGLFSAYLTLHM